jgi:hypothetical protein
MTLIAKVAPLRPSFDMIAVCAKHCQARIDALGLKGPKRVGDEAIAYACGFAQALAQAGFDISPLDAWIQFDLAFDAKRAIKRALEE